MSQNRMSAAALALMAILLSGSAFAQNIVVNPGFEYPVLPASPADNPPYWTSNSDEASTSDMWWVFQSIPGWVSDVGAGVEVKRGIIEGSGPNSGDQRVELDSDSERGGLGDVTTNSCIYQDLPTDRHHLYELSFWYRPRTESPGDNTIEVYWDGALVETADASDPDAGWREIVVSGLEATASWTELRFCASGTENELGGEIDDVFVDEIHKPHAKVSDVEIDSVYEGVVTGSFCITNTSKGDVTYAMLDDVTVSLKSKVDGHYEDLGGECTVEPEATMDVLAPHEVKCYTFTCSELNFEPDPDVDTKAQVCVEGAWNQLGEYHGHKSCDTGKWEGEEGEEDEEEVEVE